MKHRELEKHGHGVPATATGAGDLRRLKKAFLSEQDVSPASRKTYGYQFDAWLRFLENEGVPVGSVQMPDVLRFKERLAATHHAGRTVAGYMNVIRLFYRWTSEKGLYPDITAHLKVRSGAKKYSRMHLTAEQGRQLLSAAKADHLSLRNHAILNLVLHTGLRTIEISRAKISDIQYYEGTRILRVRGKGRGEDNTEDFVVLIDDAYLPIKEYLGAERPGALEGEPLFTTDGDGHRGGRLSTRTIQDICKRNLRKIGLDSRSFSAHSLRHTTAMQLLQAGGSLYDVQRVLRHANAETTRIYEESYRDQKHVQDAPEGMLAGIFAIEENKEEG